MRKSDWILHRRDFLGVTVIIDNRKYNHEIIVTPCYVNTYKEFPHEKEENKEIYKKCKYLYDNNFGVLISINILETEPNLKYKFLLEVVHLGIYLPYKCYEYFYHNQKKQTNEINEKTFRDEIHDAVSYMIENIDFNSEEFKRTLKHVDREKKITVTKKDRGKDESRKRQFEKLYKEDQ